LILNILNTIYKKFPLHIYQVSSYILFEEKFKIFNFLVDIKN
jgi:hypothetical protein